MGGHGWARLTVAAMCASLVGLGACNRNGNKANDTTAGAASGEVARRDTAAPAAAPATTPAPASPTTSSNAISITGGDPEILQVLAVVDQGEIKDGQLAQRQAKSSQVKSYARELVADHSKSLQQDRSLAKQAKVDLSSIVPSSATKSKDSTSSTTSSQALSPVASQLQSAHTQMMDQLNGLKGAAFDSAFVAAEVQGHQQVLNMLQSAEGQAQNSGVQQHVKAAVKSVQDHLDRGQKLQQSLASGGTNTTGDSAKRDNRTKRDSATKRDTTKKPD